MFVYLLNTIVILLQCGLFFLGCYYFTISIFSLIPKKHKLRDANKYRYAVVIPAHNEAHCLPALFRSLKEQTYPENLFHVFVMADHCTDNTYDVAKKNNAIPLLRTTRDEYGKGSALADAFSQIKSMPIHFDAYVVMDADNIADPRFLEEINNCMQQGASVVQGYIDSKNPYESWLSHAYSIWYWLTNRTIQSGFDRLGLGCKLGGTGFAIRENILDSVPWKTSTLAEDAEYTILLSLENVLVTYASKAIVYDEKPCFLSHSLKQRIRWTQGITQVQRDLCGKIIKRQKWTAFFRFWSDLLIPLCLSVFLLIDICAVASFHSVSSPLFVRLWNHPIPFIFLNIYLLGTLFTSVYGLLLDKKWNAKILLNCFGSILYLLTWIPAGIWGILRHNNKEWYHTKHHSKK